MKEYFVEKNGERVDLDFKELIQLAEDYGYKEEGGIYLTSQAAKVLRDNGYFVGRNE